MPLPFILGAGAAIAGAIGVGSGIHGAKKMKDANDTLKSAQSRHERNVAKFEAKNETTTKTMDELGKLELKILESFEAFSNTFEKIKNRPEFKNVRVEGVDLPEYDPEKLKQVSVGAGVLLGGIGGAAAGTAGGFAAAGATTAAVMAIGTASTGTAISSLSGVAATNATLAALGGGSLAAGGGGMALGSAVLGGATLGVGLLVGGVIFNITGSKLSDKADEAWSQMRAAEDKIDRICEYLDSLNRIALQYYTSVSDASKVYFRHLETMKAIVARSDDWYTYSESERMCIQNATLLVGLMYKMCQTKLVYKSGDDDLNQINEQEVNTVIEEAAHVTYKLRF